MGLAIPGLSLGEGQALPKGYITFNEVTAPAATNVSIYRDNDGDLTLTALTGKSVILAVAGTDFLTVGENESSFVVGTGSLLIYTTGNNDGIKLTADHGNPNGPRILLAHNSDGGIANEDIVGLLEIDGDDVGGTNNLWGSIGCIITDLTEDSEETRFDLTLIAGGASNLAMTLTGGGKLILDLGIELGGDVVLTGQATDIDLIDNTVAALTISAGVGGVDMLDINTTDDAEIFTIMRGLPFKRFHATVTLDTIDEESDVGLTPSAVILSAAIRVSTEIAGLDSDNHTINLGVNGDIAKYASVAEGGASTTISVNKKAKYTFDPTTDTEAAALVLTIGVGTDKTPSAGAVEVEVIYLDSADLASV